MQEYFQNQLNIIYTFQKQWIELNQWNWDRQTLKHWFLFNPATKYYRYPQITFYVLLNLGQKVHTKFQSPYNVWCDADCGGKGNTEWNNDGCLHWLLSNQTPALGDNDMDWVHAPAGVLPLPAPGSRYWEEVGFDDWYGPAWPCPALIVSMSLSHFNQTFSASMNHW